MAEVAVGDVAEWWADRAPSDAALTGDSGTLTWARLAELSRRTAHGLRAAGVGHGDLVPLLMPNGIEPFVATLGVWRVGAVPLPVSPRTAAAELDAILRVAKPRIVVEAGGGSLRGYARVGLPELFGGPESHTSVEPPFLKASLSGGSTGRPKVIVSRMPGRVDPESAPFLMRPRGCHLLAGPVHHSGPYTLALLGLVRGNHLVTLPRFTAESALAALDRYRIDWTFMVPTMLRRLMALAPETRARADLGALRAVVHAGSKCAIDLKRALIEWLGPDRVHEFYGGTEANGGTWITGAEWLEHPGSVGRPAPGYAMRILREDGTPAPPHEVGEIYMRPDGGPGSTYFYIGAEPRAQADGWESLGDLGWSDEDGYLYIADRRIDLIVRGGANVYPAEVEHALLAHPQVRGAVVVGVDDHDLGQRVHAFLETDGPLSLGEIHAFLENRLTRYKWPESVAFTAEPLLDDGGKVRRIALRERANAMLRGELT